MPLAHRPRGRLRRHVGSAPAARQGHPGRAGKHLVEARFVHPSALFAPPIEKVTAWVERFSGGAELDDEFEASPEDAGVLVDAHAEDGEADVDESDVYQSLGGFAEAAE